MGGVSTIASSTLQAFSLANQVLSTFRPTANVIGSGLDLFGGGDDGQSQALSQLRKEQRFEEKRARERAELQRAEILAQAQQAERKRVSALKRAVARQRANFGSQGVGSAGGSAQAVLLGLFEESDDELAQREKLDRLRLQAVDQDYAHLKRVNTLKRTEFQEKNRLAKNSADDSLLSDIFGIFG